MAAPASQPVPIGGDWWMATGPTGQPYYHNTVTSETTWTKPDIPGGGGGAAAGAPVQSYQSNVGGGGDDGAPPSMDHSQPVEVKGTGNIPAAWLEFDQVQFPRNMIEPMLEAKFQRPSAIQAYAWPILGTGRDVIGVAKTGSGKTLGFLLPGFTKMLVERLGGSPIMLVMAPTRELAVQIDADARRFATSAGIVTSLAYGGAPKQDQLRDMRKRPHLLVGTPGRLNDFLEARQLNLNDIRFLVLDEADRMLDMGFEPQIRKIISRMPSSRQTLMFTATWPKEIRRMASDFFNDPIEIRIGNVDELQANQDIDQQVYVCRDIRDKERKLVEALRKSEGQAIIFTATKRGCDTLARQLERMGVRTEAIHGDRDQAARDRALNAFKSGNSKILVATDVAARGLDVKAVKLVVNFDPANNAEDYVHRIGRTGRAGQKGTAVSLLCENEAKKANDILQVMSKSGKPIPPELERLAGEATGGGRRRGGGGGKGGGKGGKGGRSRSRSRGGGGRGRSRSRSRRGDRGGYGGGGGGYGGGMPMGGGGYGMPMGGGYGGGMPGYGGGY
eukprot:TRINITY_DN600_c0_g2_i7.p1 TRINITY_DN600_c0_g2~~TRINITY_DN600_c0_g2_i7.p1  ORF type:complete len:559 (+),score=133.64 TRINITY_DN600_c0_g2_i7:128-1804(+)